MRLNRDLEGMLAARAANLESNVIRDILAVTEQPGMRSLAGGLPAPEGFPAARLAEATARIAATDPGTALQYSPSAGLAALREQIAGRIERRDLGRFAADQVLVTHGSQQALDLVAKALLDPGDEVALDEPGYLGAVQVLRLFQARLVPVPVDADGLDTEALEHTLAAGARPKLLYTVANFQNPTGGTLSLDRRHHLAALADTYGFLILEDDPYGELRFEGDALPGLATLSDRVIHLGTFSKILFPGLRLGYVAAPAALQPALLKMKQAADLHSSTWSQRLLVELLADEVEMAAHIDRLRTLYKERRDALLGALEAHIGPHASWNRPTGGMFTWVRLGRARAADLFEAALRRRVAFVPGAPFFTGVPDPSSLRLSYSTLPPVELESAVADLAAALREVVAAA